MHCVLERSRLSLVTLSASWVDFIPFDYTFCLTVGGSRFSCQVLELSVHYGLV